MRDGGSARVSEFKREPPPLQEFASLAHVFRPRGDAPHPTKARYAGPAKRDRSYQKAL